MRKYYEKPNSLKDMLNNSAEAYGDKVFLRSINKDDSLKEITYTEFRQENEYLGTAFFSLGLCGKTIAVLSESRHEWIQTYIVAIAGNGIIVPLDKELATEQIANFIKRANVDAIVFSDSFDSRMKTISDELDGVKYFINMDCYDVNYRDTRYLGYTKLLDIGSNLMECGVSDYIGMKNDPAKLSAIIFTSGTTGTSKGVMLSEANILACIHASSNMVNFSEEDEVVSVLPFHHTYETCCGILTPLRLGMTVDINNSLKYTLKNFKRFKPTGLILVPLFVTTIYKKINEEIKKTNKQKIFNLGIRISGIARRLHVDIRKPLFKQITDSFGGRLTKIICGGAALDPELVDRFDEIGINISQGYGITECAPLLAVNPYYAIKSASVGVPAIGCDVRIAEYDKDGNTIFLPANTAGEIIAKGPNVMLGYFENPEETAKSFTAEGYFRTGDIGYIDEHGYIYITGRKKNVIVLNNGKNVFPEEIEEYLYKLDFVAECVVVGREAKGEITLTALIYPDYTKFEGMSQNDILSIVKAKVLETNKHLPSFKQIRSIEIRKNEFEKTTTKKIIRYKLNEKE